MDRLFAIQNLTSGLKHLQEPSKQGGSNQGFLLHGFTVRLYELAAVACNHAAYTFHLMDRCEPC